MGESEVDDVMADFIFSDFYRTVVLSALSALIAFCARNVDKRKRILALAGYVVIMFMPFIWIFIICMIFANFDSESIKAIVPLEIKWILYFTAITVLQFATYRLLWESRKTYKVLALFLCAVIVILPFFTLLFKDLIYWNV